MSNKLYRYEYNRQTENPLDKVEPVLLDFEIKRTTKKGCFITVYRKDVFVLSSAKNRFAYPSPEEAKQGFIRRKKSELTILKQRIQLAEAYLKYFETNE